MAISEINVQGIRSFKNLSKINLALPDSLTKGSGLNILVGPNNSGKSSLIETLFLANSSNLSMIPSTIRNSESVSGVFIKILFDNNSSKTLKSKINNPSIIDSFHYDENGKKTIDYNPFAYIISPNRNIGMNNNKNSENWLDFLYNNGGTNYREDNLSNIIGGRFLSIVEHNKELFDLELKYILGYLPEWTLDSNDSYNMFISFKNGNITHPNNGAGDGFINLFIILTSIYDAPDNSTIVIDEPEISLHPDVQKRLMQRLIYHSKNKQIIISTHSPYFVDLNLITTGAKLFRFVKEKDNTNIYTIHQENISNIEKLNNTIEQPYLQDIKSREIFFYDKLILVEGIDDIYGYDSLFKHFKYYNPGHFYGWGVGGAERIEYILPILSDLNFKKVVVLLDNDKKDLYTKLTKLYPKYKIILIPAKDIRNKEATDLKNIKKIINEMKKRLSINQSSVLDDFYNEYKEKEKIIGIIQKRHPLSINSEYYDDIKQIIEEIKTYFSDIDVVTEEDINILHETIIKISNAEQLLENYVSEHPEKTSSYLLNKYNQIEFKIHDFSYNFLRKENNILVYELEEIAKKDNEHLIIMSSHARINLENNEIVITDHKELQNNINN